MSIPVQKVEKAILSRTSEQGLSSVHVRIQFFEGEKADIFELQTNDCKVGYNHDPMRDFNTKIRAAIQGRDDKITGYEISGVANGEEFLVKSDPPLEPVKKKKAKKEKKDDAGDE